MLRKAGILFGLMAALALAAACSDDDEKKDKGLPKVEAGLEATAGYEATVGLEPVAGKEFSVNPEGIVSWETSVGEALPTGSYGSICTLGSTTCTAPGSCIGISGGSTTNGFCSKPCTGSTDTSCQTGAPGKTYGVCALQSSTKSDAGTTLYFCAFICMYGTSTYPCPPGLTCKSASGSPGVMVCYP